MISYHIWGNETVQAVEIHSKKCKDLIFCMAKNTPVDGLVTKVSNAPALHDMAMVLIKFAQNIILRSRQCKCYWNSNCFSLILLKILRIALQRSVIYNIAIIMQNFATSWKYFPVDG